MKSKPVWHAYDVEFEFVVAQDVASPIRVDAAVSEPQAMVIAARLVEKRLGLPKNYFGKRLEYIQHWFYNMRAVRVSEQPVLKMRKRQQWQQQRLALQG